MKWTRTVALAIPALALSWAVHAAAQPPGPGGHRPVGPGAFGPGGPMGFFGGPGGPDGPRVVEGAPYRAQFSTETVQTLGDGNRIFRRVTGTVARDGAGRVRREHSIQGHDGDAHGMTAIDDPVAGVRYMLFADRKVAHKMPMGRPGDGGDRMRPERGDRPGRPEGDRPAPKTESLGKRTIAGVEAEGTRETIAIPAGAFGNEKAVEIVAEKWYAPDLQIVVEARRRDPLHGDSTYTLTGITRGEPDASLFEVPAGYSLEEGPGPGHHPGPGGRR
jgi:hypothetical protein